MIEVLHCQQYMRNVDDVDKIKQNFYISGFPVKTSFNLNVNYKYLPLKKQTTVHDIKNENEITWFRLQQHCFSSDRSCDC